MKNKKGFTLIEVIVSVVLVSVVMVSLLGSLIQLRQTYSVIHEDSDIIVYSSSISRVINNDLAMNNGIRYCSCSADGQSCDVVLGNDQKRHLEIIKKSKCYENGTEKSCSGTFTSKDEIIKTTLKYTNNTIAENSKLIYIRTLDLKKHTKNGITTTSGYNFADMSTTIYEHDIDDSKAKVDQYTEILIRLNNDVNEDISKYDILLYTAGRYDYENLIGNTFTLELNSNGATIAGTTRIDEVFGVGYFLTDENHTVQNQISLKKLITIPQNGTKAFLGYFYRPAGSDQKIQVIDSNGMVVTSSRFFKDKVEMNLENDVNKAVIMAEWADCIDGYELKNGRCRPKTFNVTLNKNGGTGGLDKYSVAFMSLVPDSGVPYKAGYQFTGYYNGTRQYNDSQGKGKFIYNIPNNTTATANYTACPQEHVQTWKQNNNCEIDTCMTGFRKVGSGSSSICEGYIFTATFNKNGATNIGATSLTCTVTDDSGKCNITAPTITRSGFTSKGWNTSASANNGQTTLTLSQNTTYYAITTKKVTITFNKNGNGGSNTTRTCDIWNTATTCSITSPAITPASGFTTIGYSTAASTHSSAWNQNTAKNVNANATYYAQSSKAGKTYTATYNKGANTNKIGKTSDNCSIGAVYNGATQGTSCNVTLPSITPNSGSISVGWSTTNGATSGTAAGKALALSANKTLYGNSIKHGNSDHEWKAIGTKVFPTNGWCVGGGTSCANMVYKAKAIYCKLCGMSVDYYKFTLGYSSAPISSRLDPDCNGISTSLSGWVVFDDSSLSAWEGDNSVAKHSSGTFPLGTAAEPRCIP